MKEDVAVENITIDQDDETAIKNVARWMEIVKGSAQNKRPTGCPRGGGRGRGPLGNFLERQ